MADTVREGGTENREGEGPDSDRKPSEEEVEASIRRILKAHGETFELLADS